MLETRLGSNQLFETIFHNTQEMILVIDGQGKILLANKVFLANLKLQEPEVTGKKLKDFVSPIYEDHSFYDQIRETLRSKDSWQGDLYLRGKENLYPLYVRIKPFANPDRISRTMYLFSARDLSSEIVRLNHNLACFDQLTSLPNRFMFKKKLEYALEQGKRFQFNIGLLYINLDNFKYINKSYGYLAGDELLMQVSRRLETSARKADILGYFGGDEFVVALVNIALPRLAATIANRFLVKISLPFLVQQEKFNLGASIGISVFPADGSDYETLVCCAETAMHSLKEQPEPENSYRFFQQEMNFDSSLRLRLESDLRKALHKEEFELFFQPIVSLESQNISGLEALLRWRHPERGLIAPNQFIPIAEELGLIIPIGEWAIQSACRQAGSWQRLGIPPLEISVNLSQIQFRDKDILEKIKAIITESGIDPALLQIEITESSISEDIQAAVAVLQGLKDLGVKIAIDDFGTGTSSLGTLKNLPVDTLKLDRSFIRSLPESSNDQAIVQAILSLGKIMDLKIIAEGIETQDQLEFLQNTRCDAYQGFYYSRPLPGKEIAELLQNEILK
ncbi:MAG: EAL domain-containing protein [Desulfohalobiaceae bacterium]|nr:EAL domain-containing protein [Desulfohalobiaceae bacterium]